MLAPLVGRRKETGHMVTQAHIRAANAARRCLSGSAHRSFGILDSFFPVRFRIGIARGDPEVTAHQQRIESLQVFGSSEREAAFLTLAGLHSGYFLRRQYNRFAGCQHGRTVVQLVNRMASNRHSRTMVFPDNTGVYHLCSRPLYQALEAGWRWSGVRDHPRYGSVRRPGFRGLPDTRLGAQLRVSRDLHQPLNRLPRCRER